MSIKLYYSALQGGHACPWIASCPLWILHHLHKLSFKFVNSLTVFKIHEGIIMHILLIWHQHTDPQTSPPHCILLHSHLHTSHPGRMSITLKFQLVSNHMPPISIVQMSGKYNFCSIALFVPLCFCLYSFSAAINLFTGKEWGKHINWKTDYTALKALLLLPPVSRNGISRGVFSLT